MRRSVSCRLEADVAAPSDVVLGVAVASSATATELLSITLDGTEIAVSELAAEHGTRLHVLRGVACGSLTVSYEAVVSGRAAEAPVDDLDLVRYLRPSRYCESDRIASFARSEFRELSGQPLLDAVSSWVGMRVAYVSGSSRPIDGAVSTLLAREGVCRDFAHLVIAILRACDTPARMVSAYAPGLEPMDFHAVVEAYVDGEWLVVDATLLAPRRGLVRIATGRDAADTAFLTSTGGSVTLVDLTVGAITESALPDDDITKPSTLG
jgi:hypothetical protein